MPTFSSKRIIMGIATIGVAMWVLVARNPTEASGTISSIPKDCVKDGRGDQCGCVLECSESGALKLRKFTPGLTVDCQYAPVEPKTSPGTTCHRYSISKR